MVADENDCGFKLNELEVSIVTSDVDGDCSFELRVELRREVLGHRFY